MMEGATWMSIPHESCGYEVVNGIAYALWAGGIKGGKSAMIKECK